MTLTEAQRKGLEILKAHPGIGADGFAREMWPDSVCWKHYTKKGHGSSRGGGMAVAAGCFVGKLKRQGWVRDSFRTAPFGTAYELSEKGKEILNEAGTLQEIQRHES